ncbi:hypothetical protein C4D60_Mb00t17960 [Musa balbisiana]|uniref:Uncharacterized protein n=1 Tax=Musa balbisiana TaxID=52838 RepID=A0A4S8I3Y0_MUSBA|nr:hypothetical protein C4D60_Mb00t17960 [Musa balbisiana]
MLAQSKEIMRKLYRIIMKLRDQKLIPMIEALYTQATESIQRLWNIISGTRTKPFLPQAFNNMAVICHYSRSTKVLSSGVASDPKDNGAQVKKNRLPSRYEVGNFTVRFKGRNHLFRPGEKRPFYRVFELRRLGSIKLLSLEQAIALSPGNYIEAPNCEITRRFE